MGSRMRTMVAGCLAVALVGSAAAASAAPGGVDATLGTSGAVAITGFAEDVLVTSDRILVLSASTTGLNQSTLHVRARTLAGAADATFSGDGALDITADLQVTTGEVAVDADGKVLVAVGGTSGGSIGQKVWRLTSAGVVDTSFSGDGVQPFDNLGLFSQVNGLGVQPDGDIVVGLNDSNPLGGLSQLPQLVRMNSSGTVQQTVDVLADYASYGSLADLAVDSTGRPHVLLPIDGKLIVRRYTDALALDNSFSGDGIATIARPGASDNDNRGGTISVDGTGRVLVAGTVATRVDGFPPLVTETATIVGRLSATGAADTTFSGDGVATVARPTGMIAPVAVAATASGGVAVYASKSLEDSSTVGGLLWELTSAGAAATGFSGDGRAELSGWPQAGAALQGGTRFLTLASDDGGTAGSLTSIELITPPPATAPPAPVTPTTPGASGTTVNVSFKLPATDGGSPITGASVLVYPGTSATPSATVSNLLPGVGAGQNVQFTVTGLSPGTTYRFKARATNAIGDGALSAFSGFAIPPFATVDRFITQQFADLTARTPTGAERSDLSARLQIGTVTPAAAVAEVAAKPEWATLDPLTRIYYAYFGRAPDSSGLRYWLGKRRAGTKVSTISNQFVTSNEFKTKYGTLTNRKFVELVYLNVLGRPGDTAGINSWTAKLDAGTKTRGDVMVQFSESSEHKRRRAGEVNTVSVIFGMLLRAPSTSEFTTWVPLAKTSKDALIADVLARATYDARIPSA